MVNVDLVFSKFSENMFLIASLIKNANVPKYPRVLFPCRQRMLVSVWFWIAMVDAEEGRGHRRCSARVSLKDRQVATDST